mgnify:FL=1
MGRQVFRANTCHMWSEPNHLQSKQSPASSSADQPYLLRGLKTTEWLNQRQSYYQLLDIVSTFTYQIHIYYIYLYVLCHIHFSLVKHSLLSIFSTWTKTAGQLVFRESEGSLVVHHIRFYARVSLIDNRRASGVPGTLYNNLRRETG